MIGKGPYIPEHPVAECTEGHMTLIQMYGGDVEQCRRCGMHVTPGGRVSKNKKKRDWPPTPSYRPPHRPD